MNAESLSRLHCAPRKGKEHALAADEIREHLQSLPGWAVDADGGGIRKTFRFDDFHRTIAFVNAVAWIAHVEDHHPDLQVSYPSCEVFYSTHDVGGLSLNDFICAAKVEELLGFR
jgi:4a-hydroxytetrahydrobiopterin dehydratase